MQRHLKTTTPVAESSYPGLWLFKSGPCTIKERFLRLNYVIRRAVRNQKKQGQLYFVRISGGREGFREHKKVDTYANWLVAFYPLHNYSLKSLTFCKTALQAHYFVVRQKMREDLNFYFTSGVRLKICKAYIIFSFGKDITSHVSKKL